MRRLAFKERSNPVIFRIQADGVRTVLKWCGHHQKISNGCICDIGMQMLRQLLREIRSNLILNRDLSFIL